MDKQRETFEKWYKDFYSCADIRDPSEYLFREGAYFDGNILVEDTTHEFTVWQAATKQAELLESRKPSITNTIPYSTEEVEALQEEIGKARKQNLILCSQVELMTEENVKLQKLNDNYKEKLSSLYRSALRNTGHEPSLSCFHRAMHEAFEAIHDDTPTSTEDN